MENYLNWVKLAQNGSHIGDLTQSLGKLLPRLITLILYHFKSTLSFNGTKIAFKISCIEQIRTSLKLNHFVAAFTSYQQIFRNIAEETNRERDLVVNHLSYNSV